MKKFLLITLLAILFVTPAFAVYIPEDIYEDIYIDDVYDFCDEFSAEEKENGTFYDLEGTDYRVWIPNSFGVKISPASDSQADSWVLLYHDQNEKSLEIEVQFTETPYEEQAAFLMSDCMDDIIDSVYLLFANDIPAIFYYYDDRCGNVFYMMEYYVEENKRIQFRLVYSEDEDFEYMSEGCQIMYSFQQSVK